jgi:hypothetical protein
MVRPCTFLTGSLTAVIISLICPLQLTLHLHAAMSAQCEAPEYFGMCDPWEAVWLLGRDASSPGSTLSSFLRHLYRHRRVTPNSWANSPTSSQVRRR